MMKQIEMMTESISPYNEIILFGHGYKRTELERARDQFDDVTVLMFGHGYKRTELEGLRISLTM